MITYLDVTDQEAFDAYRKAAIPSLEPYRVSSLVVDGRFEVLEGMVRPKSIVILEFESMEHAKQWYESSEYAPAIPMRQQAAESSVILVEGVSDTA